MTLPDAGLQVVLMRPHTNTRTTDILALAIPVHRARLTAGPVGRRQAITLVARATEGPNLLFKHVLGQTERSIQIMRIFRIEISLTIVILAGSCSCNQQ